MWAAGATRFPTRAAAPPSGANCCAAASGPMTAASPATPLSDAVLAEFDNDLGSRWSTGSARRAPSDYARFAPLVLEHAEQRDPLGVAIVAEGRRRTERDRHAPARSRRARHLPVRRTGRAACGPGFRRPFRRPSPPPSRMRSTAPSCWRATRFRRRHDMTEPSGEALDLRCPWMTAIRRRSISSSSNPSRMPCARARSRPMRRFPASAISPSSSAFRASPCARPSRAWCKKGVLVQRWGSGTFIAPQMRLEQPLSRLSSFTDDMSARGLQSSAVLLSRSTGQASHGRADGARSLAGRSREPREPPAPCQRHSDGDRDMRSFRRRFLPDPSLVKQSLYAVLHDQGFMPTPRPAAAARGAADRGTGLPARAFRPRARRSISSAAPSRPAGEVVEFTSSYYRGDAYDFVAELTIGQPERMQNDDA